MVGWSRIAPGKPETDTRKVRAPRRRVAGNTRPPRGEDQRHSDEPAGLREQPGPGETGKLYPEQGQIGGQGGPGNGIPTRSGVASPSGRPHEASGNRRPRWMTITAIRGGTELGLQAASLTFRRFAVSSVRPFVRRRSARPLPRSVAPVNPRTRT